MCEAQLGSCKDPQPLEAGGARQQGARQASYQRPGPAEGRKTWRLGTALRPVTRTAKQKGDLETHGVIRKLTLRLSTARVRPLNRVSGADPNQVAVPLYWHKSQDVFGSGGQSMSLVPSSLRVTLPAAWERSGQDCSGCRPPRTSCRKEHETRDSEKTCKASENRSSGSKETNAYQVLGTLPPEASPRRLAACQQAKALMKSVLRGHLHMSRHYLV